MCFTPGCWSWFFALPWASFFTVLNGFLLIAIAGIVGYYGWRHTRNAVAPLLQFTLNAPVDERRENPTVSLELVNKGLGPAIVTSFELYVDDQVMCTSDDLPNWRKILAKIGIPPEVFGNCAHPGTGRRAFAVNETLTIVSMMGQWDESGEMQPLTVELQEYCRNQLLKHVRINVCFESIHGETMEPARFLTPKSLER